MTREPSSLIDALDRAAESWSEAPALRFKRDGRWISRNWREYRDEVKLAARGMMALGLAPGQGVAIMSFNRPEWLVANLGAIAAGGIPAGIYTTSSAEQVRYVAEHCGAAIAVLQNRELLERFSSVEDRLPHLAASVVLDDAPERKGVLGWTRLLERASEVSEAELEERLDRLRPTQLATLIYTSGTTGPPKAVMLSHQNLLWMGSQVVRQTAMVRDDALLSYLPLCHIAEQSLSHHAPLLSGASVAFAESMEALPENLREIRPHVFFGVPRVWEKMQSAIAVAAARRPAPLRRLGAWARRVGLQAGYAQQRGEAPPWLLPLARRLVHAPVRARLGLDRARICATSAAPIGLDTLEYFLGLGIPILEVYGMSECSGPATTAQPNRYRTGTAGFALEGGELRIAEDGEVLIRGPHVFLGYYRDAEATEAVRDPDGWLHSGDIGSIDEQGFLRITDRKKELIITAGGKNVAPQIIEGKLREISLVSQAVVVGDRRPYLTALLTLDPARLAHAAAESGSPARTPEEACQCPRLRAWLETRVAEVNGGLARYETVRRFRVLPRELSVAADELTPTLKLKRRVIRERYAREIDELYA
jgi:long-subunit acyl-CoA synthetase (AMP-forming)